MCVLCRSALNRRNSTWKQQRIKQRDFFQRRMSLIQSSRRPTVPQHNEEQDDNVNNGNNENGENERIEVSLDVLAIEGLMKRRSSNPNNPRTKRRQLKQFMQMPLTSSQRKDSNSLVNQDINNNNDQNDDRLSECYAKTEGAYSVTDRSRVSSVRTDLLSDADETTDLVVPIAVNADVCGDKWTDFFNSIEQQQQQKEDDNKE